MYLPLVGLKIHYNLQQNIENYLRKSGRTARIYNKCISTAFAGPGDTKGLIAIEKLLGKRINKYNTDVEKVRQAEEVVGLESEVFEKWVKAWEVESIIAGPIEQLKQLVLIQSAHQGQVSKKHIKNLKKILNKAKLKWITKKES